MANGSAPARRRLTRSLRLSAAAVLAAATIVATSTTGGASFTCSTAQTWSLGSLGSGDWRNVAFGNGTWVAVSQAPQSIAYSTDDGTTWTSAVPPVNANWFAVGYGGPTGQEKFVAMSTTNHIATSPDGVTWTLQSSPAPSNTQFADVAYGGGRFVGVGGASTTRVVSSPDGITWTGGNIDNSRQWTSVTYGNGTWVAVSFDGYVATSPDGLVWSAASAAPQTNQWRSVAYGNNTFLAVAQNGTNRAMTSPDGVTWTVSPTAPANQFYEVAFGDGVFAAVAIGGTAQKSAFTVDGQTWNPVATPSPGTQLWSSVAHGNGKFLAVGYSSSNAPDGSMTSSCTPAQAPQTPTSPVGPAYTG